MQKPIIALSVKGVVFTNEPWENAHKLWFSNKADELNDPSVLNWVEQENYFAGVDEVMKRLHPDLSDEERTVQARVEYFESVVEYIKTHDVVREDMVKLLQEMKNSYLLAAVTTNTKESLHRILKQANLTQLFDIVTTSRPDEKDDKELVLSRLYSEHSNIHAFLGSDSQEITSFCSKHDIAFIKVTGDTSAESVQQSIKNSL